MAIGIAFQNELSVVIANVLNPFKGDAQPKSVQICD